MRHLGARVRFGALSLGAAIAAVALVLVAQPAGTAHAGQPASRGARTGLPASRGARTGQPASRGARTGLPAFPASMAALGDSITQAFDSLGYGGLLRSEPQYSWATGYANPKIVDSQYLRLLAVDPKIKGNEHNDSVVGAKMSGLGAQVAEAIRQKAQYVVILMGANDVCTRTIAGMTPVAQFSSTFTRDLATLMKGLPKGSHVFVSSLPNVFQLWSILHTNRIAESRWAFGVCQSMLSPRNTPSDRALVLARDEAFNSALATACKRYAACRFDNLAVFDNKFTPNEINSLDFYHPDLIGQNRLADVTWARSWWPAST